MSQAKIPSSHYGTYLVRFPIDDLGYKVLRKLDPRRRVGHVSKYS